MIILISMNCRQQREVCFSPDPYSDDLVRTYHFIRKKRKEKKKKNFGKAFQSLEETEQMS